MKLKLDLQETLKEFVILFLFGVCVIFTLTSYNFGEMHSSPDILRLQKHSKIMCNAPTYYKLKSQVKNWFWN